MRKANKGKIRGGLMMSWLVSYLIVLMLPIIAYGVTWVVTDRVVEDEVCDNNLLTVQQMRKLLEERLDDALCVRDYLRADTKLATLFPLHLPLSAQDRYDIWRASESVNQQIELNQFIKSGYVYLRATGQAMCNASLYDFGLMMKDQHADDLLDPAAWEETLRAYHYSDFVTIPLRSGGSRIALLSSLPTSTLTQPSATLVLLLDTRNYLSNVTDIQLNDDSAFFLLDEAGCVVAENLDANEELLPPIEQMSGESGCFTRRVKGQKLAFTYATLKNTGWRYVCVSRLTISQRLTYLKMLMIASIVGSALCGLLLAYWLAKRKFSDIHGLIDRLARKTVSTQAISGNEYQQIEQILDDTLRNTDQLDRIVQTQTEQLRRHALERLLLSPLDDAGFLSAAGISFRYEYFHVILFFLNETTETTIDPAERSELLRRAMDALLAQCEGFADAQSLLRDDLGVVLLNTERESLPSERADAMLEAIRRQQQSLRARFRFLGVSISSPCAGLEKIRQAYQEAYDWVSYALMLPPGNNAIYHAEKDEMNAQRFVATALQENLLSEAIASGNETAALSLVEKLCAPLHSAPVDLSIARCFFFDLLAGLMRAQSGEEAQSLIHQAVREVESARSPQQMQSSLRQTVAQLVRRQAPVSPSGDLLEEIMRLIEENYHDADFNITRLAEMLGRNLSYLSKYFKDRTGVGLYDYLNRARIAQAKRLIDQSDAPISSLIGQAGFENLGSFIRVFKKYEGMTPGAYQKGEKP